jgi:hypothetical protein
VQLLTDSGTERIHQGNEGAVSLSIVVSNVSPSRTAMMAMPWRPSGPLTNSMDMGEPVKRDGPILMSVPMGANSRIPMQVVDYEGFMKILRSVPDPLA